MAGLLFRRYFLMLLIHANVSKKFSPVFLCSGSVFVNSVVPGRVLALILKCSAILLLIIGTPLLLIQHSSLLILFMLTCQLHLLKSIGLSGGKSNLSCSIQ